jgi:hypothetical protein
MDLASGPSSTSPLLFGMMSYTLLTCTGYTIYILTTTYCLSPYLGSVEDALWLQGVWGQAKDVQRGAGTWGAKLVALTILETEIIII